MKQSFESERRRGAGAFVAERLGDRSEAVPSRRALVEANLHRLQAQPKRLATWSALGPRPLEQKLSGQVTEVSGRAAGIAVHRDGKTVYVAAANGGVWRSGDGGRQWTFTMGDFDLDPRTHKADTLSCGAIALDPADPDRVWVGTGEAATGVYLGVGPLVSVDGGRHWSVEPSDPPLEGKGFYELAVDPSDPDRVLAATTAGLYRREFAGSGTATWRRTPEGEGEFTSVVAGRHANATVLYAARWGGVIVGSDDGGATWNVLGRGFPDREFGRVSLALPGDDGSLVFALAADAGGGFGGVYRLDHNSGGGWQELTGAPSALFEEHAGSWCQAIAVDPSDPTRFFLGGSTFEVDRTWSGALFRCEVGPRGQDFTPTFVGLRVHADVQALAFVPGRPGELWAATDGGVYFAADARASGQVFESRNGDLGTLTLHHIGQHPKTEEVLCGSQDNGCVHYAGGGQLRWQTVFPGDCGFALFHWADPRRVLATVQGLELAQVWKDGAASPQVAFRAPAEFAGELSLPYPPLAYVPPPDRLDAMNVHQADRVAFGTTRPWISDDFGETWYSIPFNELADDRLGDGEGEAIRSLAFASYNRLFAGTEAGGVYRYDRDTEGVWRRTPLSAARTTVQVPLTAAAFRAPVTDILVDPGDPTLGSIYVTLGGPLEVGGEPSHQRLWHFDGAIWTPRSGSSGVPEAKWLLPVQHNAVAADPSDPSRLWVGADIGVWYSEDRGGSWRPFQHGLPDAAVIDLKIHPELRKLRAATHGLGLFEIGIDF